MKFNYIEYWGRFSGDHMLFGSLWFRWVRGIGLIVIMLAESMSMARATDPTKDVTIDVTNGYSSCSWVDGKDDSTITLTVSFKRAASYPPRDKDNGFSTRMLLVYMYNEKGRVVFGSKWATTQGYNGEKKGLNFPGWDNGASAILSYPGNNGSNRGEWANGDANVAQFKIIVPNGHISAWPAIGVRTANQVYDDYAGGYNEFDTKSVYIRRGSIGSTCEIVPDPSTPPSLDIAVDMTAPDWDLGELPRGESIKNIPGTANQLCFTYSVPRVESKHFVISASNANGVIANRYMLKNVADSTQLIPYDITLDSGTSSFSLPNVSNTALPFDSSGKTCFVPTFKTTVDAKVKEGDYSDVLTFTVVVKP